MKRVTLDYTIYLTDRTVVAERQAAVSSYRARGHLGGSYPPDQFVNYPDAGTGVMFMSPTYAAIKYPTAAVYVDGAAPAVGLPYITSPWIKSLTQTNLPIYEDVFEKKVGGWFGISWLFGTTVRFEWAAHFAYIGPALPQDGTGTPVSTPGNISRRRWIEGFELPQDGSGGSSGGTDLFSRAAARSLEGTGFSFVNSNAYKTHSCAENIPGLAPTSSWERMYIKLVANPTGSTFFWTAYGSLGAHYGAALSILPTGQIALYNDTAFNGQQLLGSVAQPLTIGSWYRLDILLKSGIGGEVALNLNGARVLTVGFGAAEGLGVLNNVHVSSRVGNSLNLNESAKLLGLFIDDWICADYPAIAANVMPNDWVNGSRVVLTRPKVLAATNAWAGDYRYLLAHGNEVSSQGPGCTSSTSGARLAVTLDAERIIDTYPGALGPVAMSVGAWITRLGLGGSLGYSVHGAAAVMAATTAASGAWNNVFFNMAAGITPASFSPIELYYDKGADGLLSTITSFAAVVEVIGQFGPEDVIPGPTTVAPQQGDTGLHNAPYPLTPWARLTTLAPLCPVAIRAGTYVGNGVAQDLSFNYPVAWLWIRNVTDATPGTYWTTTLATSHFSVQQGPNAFILPRAEMDPTFVADGIEDNQQTKAVIRLTGAAVSANINGKTFQYVAFMDPGMRFVLNGALRIHRGTLDATTPLVKPAFLAKFAMLFLETIGASTVTRLWFKGQGHATASASVVDAAETASVLSLAAGSITSKSAFANAGNQTAFTLWRTDDGSGDAGIPKVLCHYSYVGDGAASRTLPIAPASGMRPLLAFITPHNGATLFRDPSHTGTTSTAIGVSYTANAATGITAGGIDQVTIGSVLNANGVTYEFFCIPGDAVAGNNGWSENPPGDLLPVEPIVPVDGPWPPPPGDPPLPPVAPPVDPVDPPPGTPPGPTDPPGEEFGTQCVIRSTKLINRALGMIGISQPIVDVVTEQTVEATLARLNYDDCVLAVLRDFPWPFATRYAALTLAHGTPDVPANADWTYAYRAPYDMVYARRIVRDEKKRDDDTDPIKFRVGTGGINVLDTLGAEIEGYLIYTNEVLDVVTLEYTVRHLCAAGTGDALFREALLWKVAHTLAPALARDEKKIDRAQAMYERCLKTATARAANEQQQDVDDSDAPWIAGR